MKNISYRHKNFSYCALQRFMHFLAVNHSTPDYSCFYFTNPMHKLLSVNIKSQLCLDFSSILSNLSSLSLLFIIILTLISTITVVFIIVSNSFITSFVIKVIVFVSHILIFLLRYCYVTSLQCATLPSWRSSDDAIAG